MQSIESSVTIRWTASDQEATAKALHMPVMIEGYPPPFDPRILHLKVTPDPGVIEVNIHPAANWAELVHNTESLYEEARQARLCAEKFMLDGRHAGTGGGNHLLFGGPSLDDHPFFSRPAWVTSILRYWQHHPSLAYLFTGQYVGSSSQAPRPDECASGLYDLEMDYCEDQHGYWLEADEDKRVLEIMKKEEANLGRKVLAEDRFAAHLQYLRSGSFMDRMREWATDAIDPTTKPKF